MSSSVKIERLYKFGEAEPVDRAWSSAKVFTRETSRLRIASSEEQIMLLKSLLEKMPEPMWLLYVLIAPRGEGDPGRYQSRESLSREQVIAILDRFQSYLERDGRCNLWLKAEVGPDLLVIDRHDLVYAYGDMDEWAKVLAQLGWKEVDSKSLTLPDPHSHHYHAVFDDDAQHLLSSRGWDYSKLREQDY